MLLNPLRPAAGARLGFPVAPGGFPVVGHMPAIAFDGLGFVRRTQARVGPIFWIDLGFGRDELMLLGAEGFGIFKNRFTTSEYLKSMLPELFGVSVLVQDGAVHQHMRTAMNAPFMPRGLSAAEVGQVFAELIERRVRTWPARGALRILPETRELVLALIFRMLGVAEAELGEWRQQYEKLMMLAINLPFDLPGSPHRQGRLARKWLDQRLLEFVRKSRAQPTGHGILHALVHGKDDGGAALSDDELLDNLRLLVLAGHETSASTMAWMVILLAQHPRVWEALCEEACAASDLPRGPKELKRFPYAEAVFRETLRLYPPVWSNGRRAIAPFEYAGRTIPAGVQVATAIMHLSRDASLYPDPDAFQPERWLGKEEGITAIELAQFGGGPHFCLGYHLAWMEIVQFAVALGRTLRAQALRPRLVGGPPGLRYMPLLHPAASTQVVFSR
jgi:cytochrome P450